MGAQIDVLNLRLPSRHDLSCLQWKLSKKSIKKKDSIIPLLPKSEMPDLVGNPEDRFSCNMAQLAVFNFQKSIGLPDVHSGYGFAIGNMAAFDMADPNSVVSPGGVGFDINCGVRLLRTNLTEKDVQPLKEQLAQCLFDHIPVGVGSKGIIPMTAK